MAFTPLMAELINPATRAAMIFAVNREPKCLWHIVLMRFTKNGTSGWHHLSGVLHRDSSCRILDMRADCTIGAALCPTMHARLANNPSLRPRTLPKRSVPRPASKRCGMMRAHSVICTDDGWTTNNLRIFVSRSSHAKNQTKRGRGEAQANNHVENNESGVRESFLT